MRSRARPLLTDLLLPILVLVATLSPISSALSLPSIGRRAAIPGSAQARAASLPAGSSRAGDFVCRNTGECVPCPVKELGSPVCKIYGNRRPLTCISVHRSNAPHAAKATVDSSERGGHPSSPHQPRPPPTQDDPAGWQPAGLSEATVEEALELDPEPEGLDDEDLQDALRGDLAEEDEQRRRARSRRRSDFGQSLESRQNAAAREIYTWEACARVVTKERADFFEFVLCNLFFASISVAVLIYRHRALASRQFGTLAARIGMSVT